jgi:NAD(P)-dependent dehydrogenase (short-subunit alcohol dehydrogenase family)
MTLQPLKDKIVMVTGAARRVGNAIMMAFAREGAHVVIHHSGSDEDADLAAAAVTVLGVRALVVKGDYTDPAQIAANFAQVNGHFGRLDVLVNSASILGSAPFDEIAADEWGRVLDINLSAPFLATQAAARLMSAGGAIINIADVSGVHARADRAHHSVSKSGLIHLTKASALALAPRIRVNCLVLGPVLPEPGRSAESWARSAARMPLKRAGDPDDAARAALFLATNDFITGAVLHVDGGEALV